MTAPTIAPGSPEWLRIITPSKVAAILGKSRFESPYRLWHRMAGNLAPEPPRDEFTAGHAMEHALAYLWKQENPHWRLSPGEVQVHRPAANGTPAMLATVDRRAVRGRWRRIVEFKTARDLSVWGDEFTDDAPLDYYLQVQAQQLITGWTAPAHLMVMGPYFRWHTYVIEHDPLVAEKITAAAVRWHQSLEAGAPPELDDSVPTYQAVRELHPDIDGTEVQVDRTLAAEYLATADALKFAEKTARGAKTRLLDAMGNAQQANTGDIKIATRYQHGKGVAVRGNTKALTALNEGTAA
ncbi:YqaJ viral recombinase family protein [Tomitella fengzijianii]|uniref:YqaJ viral recombinase domain-containing protein n=1 Tax=Tomitella fengzijianii TaxID=2597660 RepID=A0A516X4G5_9ACTN|nr:YqaJ viral recombinase family protein [Tomitella fengzijianii]QDQ97956.1 hypothetical protein FO059_12330 [Tomitella fengzijianii]